MMNAFRKKCQLINPKHGYDSLGQPSENIRGDFNTGNLSVQSYDIADIKMYISDSPGERRISKKRESGFDYTTVTHYGITNSKNVKKGSYIRKNSQLWRVDYTVESGKNDVLVYLFKLL